jgi:hypothetical protein
MLLELLLAAGLDRLKSGVNNRTTQVIMSPSAGAKRPTRA